MRFTRFPRVVPYVVTPRKLAYARRAIQHARDRCPLFPELTDQRNAEQRMDDNARHKAGRSVLRCPHCHVTFYERPTCPSCGKAPALNLANP